MYVPPEEMLLLKNDFIRIFNIKHYKIYDISIKFTLLKKGRKRC